MPSAQQRHEHALHQVRLPNDLSFKVLTHGLHGELNGGVLIGMLWAYDCHEFVNPNESATHCSLQRIKVYRYSVVTRNTAV